MSQAAPAETTQSYLPPSVTQFSVFLDNRVGKLLELLETFDQDSQCQVCAFTVHEASDHAVVRLITNDSERAKDILKRHELPFSAKQLLVIELAEGHTLSRLCLCLLGAELNIHFAYPVMLRPNGRPTIALSIDDLTLAGQILRRKGFRLFGECDLPRPAL
ncbi:MAG: acetolactate synthase [Phycisphaerales bacterium]|nr:acetolactate synthase [Phycisphaerales bacterium]